MKPSYFLLFFIIFSCGSFLTSAQIVDSKKLKSLEEKVKQNRELFQVKPEDALLEIDKLIEEAGSLKKDTLELILLTYRTEYCYFLKTDLEQMLNSALGLQNAAINQNNLLYQAISHKYQAQAFAFNELYGRAVMELRAGLDILDKDNPDNSKVILEKAAFYLQFANIYNQKGEYFNCLNSLFNSLEEHKKLKDPEQKRGGQFMDYSGLGGTYYLINKLDSAEYFLQKSIALATDEEASHNITFVNYLMLGNVRLKQKNYEKALYYYKKAEGIKENKYHINVSALYNGLIETYTVLGDDSNRIDYENKLKDLKIKVLEEKNESLHKIVSENKTSDTSNRTKEIRYWLFVIGSIVILTLVILRIKKKKYKSEDDQKVGNPIFNTHLTLSDYDKLSELARNNDVRFLIKFEELYPNFKERINNITSLNKNEQELLAMLIIGFTTKEIADIKSIQPQSVDNLRYKLRKKLDLSSHANFNEWINEL